LLISSTIEWRYEGSSRVVSFGLVVVVVVVVEDLWFVFVLKKAGGSFQNKQR
jgi:hypothetical protein